MKKLLDFLGNRPTMAEWTGGLWSRQTVGRRQCVNIHVNTRWARFSVCTRPLLHGARSLTADGCTLAMYRKAKSVYGIAACRHAATASANRFPTIRGLTMRDHPILYRA